MPAVNSFVFYLGCISASARLSDLFFQDAFGFLEKGLFSLFFLQAAVFFAARQEKIAGMRISGFGARQGGME